MARGGKRSLKGGRKQFTNPQALEEERKKEEKEKEWRRQRGEDVSSEDEKAEKDSSSEEEESESDDEKKKNESDSGSSDEDEETGSPLIEVVNPNRQVKKDKKVSALNATVGASASKPELSRREREEIDRQVKKANYQKMHAAGMTDEAKADLARLAIVRKQREEAVKRREEEKKAKESVSIQKKTESQKALGKKSS